MLLISFVKLILFDSIFFQSQHKDGPVDPEEATRRKVRVHGNFEELLDDYLVHRVPCIEGMWVWSCLWVGVVTVSNPLSRFGG